MFLRPRRVLCLTSWYPPHHFGGYELSCRDVMVGLRRAGHEVHVLTSDHRHDGVDTTEESDVRRELRLYFRDGDLWQPSLPRRLAIERHNRRVMADVLDSVQPDVVSVWHVGAMSLGVLQQVAERGVPMTFAVSDEWPIYAPKLDPWTRATTNHPILGRLVAASTGLSSGLPNIGDAGPWCFISALTRRRCLASSPWDIGTNGIVFSGIDHPLFFQPDPPIPDDSRAPVVLYVGRIDERKGLRTLIRALAHLDDVHLVIDGRSSEAQVEMTTAWATEADVSDRVTMQCSDRSDLPALYRSASVCVFPSEWEEPFGLVPLEAMATGTPVVATGVGGSGEFLVDDVNCLLFPPGDSRALADAVRSVLSDPARRDRLVDRGHRTAEYFDVSHLTACFEKWHEYAITGHNRPDDREAPHGEE